MLDLFLGDCLEVMRGLDADSVDAIVTDPPYHLVSIVKRFGKPGSAPAQFGKDGAYKRHSTGFMGKTWDGGDIAQRPEVWLEALRVAKPGAHLLAFGGTRTYHRLVCAIEDAGWEIRDTIAWVYGQGFPKSKKSPVEGWGTALKPAMEPIVVARKPLDGTVAQNVLEHGTGALNINGCKVETSESLNGGAYSAGAGERHDGDKNWRFKRGTHGNAGEFVPPTGRWPANLIHDGSDEVVGLLQNGAARFFYCAKASRAERDKGLEDMPDRLYAQSGGAQGAEARGEEEYKQDSMGLNRISRVKNNHPTVKPVALMRYLCRLVTPPNGIILDPFMGSGSTGIAAKQEGFRFIGIEKEREYVEIARRRIEAAGEGLGI